MTKYIVSLSHIVKTVPMWSGLRFVSSLLLWALLFLTLAGGLSARAETRSLKLYNTHTRETATITYKRNGKFDADGLRKMNRFLRDWRRNEITKMDPALFDLIWEVYRKTGAKKPIYVVSGYRSPATNNMLRSRSRAVAKNSRHTKGQAMDFYLPGVATSKIRDAGLRLQAGGVGFYPRSKSPFVHIDTGNVRHWPRMTRKQLARVFPNGKTVHVPRDGKPFSGYQVAAAQVKRTKAAMARSSRSVGRFSQQQLRAGPSRVSSSKVASLSTKNQNSQPSLLSSLLNRGPKARPAPAQAQPATQAADQTGSEDPPATDQTFPLRLAILPRHRAPTSQPAGVDLVANTENTETNQAEAQLASLPRARPANLTSKGFMLASAEPIKPLPDPTAQTDGAFADTSLPDTTPVASVEKNDQQSLETMVREKLAEADARTPRPAQLDTTIKDGSEQLATVQKPKEKAVDMLASLTEPGAKPAGGGDTNRFAYASSDDTFLAKLPEAAPSYQSGSSEGTTLSALPKRAERQQVASLNKELGNNNIGLPRAKSAMIARPQPAPNLAAARQPGAGQKAGDQLARLTFAYGPSGMSNFAHIAQSTKTAQFAHLSRPIPSNLRALVSKPNQIIDQSFSQGAMVLAQDAYFKGPAIARMAIRSFE